MNWADNPRITNSATGCLPLAVATSRRNCFVMIALMTLEAALPASRQIGLCATCTHMRRIESDRGSVFFLCQLALTDGTFRKYPPLPVLQCDGYQTGRSPDRSDEEGK